MKELLKYLIVLLVGIAIGWGISLTTVILTDKPETQITNEFRKIKNKKGNTSVDVSSLVQEDTKEKRWRLFKRDR